MLPRERVCRALAHEEPDLVPWGEHLVDFTVIQDLLGRKSFVNAKFFETRALWEGKRDEVVASYLRDTVDFADAVGFDIITVKLMPRKGRAFAAPEQINEDTYRDAQGHLYRLSSVTHDLMLYELAPGPPMEPPSVESLQNEIDIIDRDEWPRPDDSEWELVRHVVKERKQTHFIAILTDDIFWPGFGRNDQEYYTNLALYPELHAKISELNAKKALKLLEWYAEEGLDGVITAGDMGTTTALLANPKVYWEHMYPWHKIYCRRAHELGLKVTKHCCGRTWEVIDGLIDSGYDAYEAVQISAGMDLRAQVPVPGQNDPLERHYARTSYTGNAGRYLAGRALRLAACRPRRWLYLRFQPLVGGQYACGQHRGDAPSPPPTGPISHTSRLDLAAIAKRARNALSFWRR